VGTPKSSDSGLKLLIISPWKSRWSLGRGAGVSDDDHFIEELSSRGVELHFLVPHSDKENDFESDDVVVHTYPNFFDATSWLPTVFKRLLWPVLFGVVVSAHAVLVARKIRPDFLLGHSHYGALPAYMCRELLRIPSGLKLFGVMDLVHIDWPPSKYYFKNIEQIGALKIPQDAWIILDDGTRGRDAALRHGVPAAKIHFFPNGLNTEWLDESFDGTQIRQSMQIAEDTKVVLFLARFVASKRPQLVIESIPEVERLLDDPAVFLFVGDGPERARCESLVRQLDLADSVKFTGAIPHSQIPEVMAASDVFVSTSNLTNVAMPTCEAMICGVPVAVFDVGNTSTMIRHGETGMVVRDGDTHALAQTIADLLRDEAHRKRIADAARQYAAENFVNWPDRIAMELDVIRGVVNNRR